MRNSISIQGALILYLVAGPLAAQTLVEDRFQWSVGADVSYYNNIELLREGGEDDTVLTTPVALILAGSGTRYYGSLWAAGQYQDYLSDTYSDETVWGAIGDVTFRVVPEILDWSIVDNYGPYWSDPLEADTPDNRAYVNYFRTGPTLTIGGNSRTRMVIEGSYARSNYSSEADTAETDDLEYWLADVALVRALDARTALSIHGAVSSTSSLTASTADSYDIYDGYLRYEGTGGRTSIKAEAGVTVLDYAGDSQTEPLLSLELERRLSEVATLYVSAGSGYGDSTASFVRLQEDGSGPNPGGPGDITGVDETLDVTALNSPRKEDYANLSLSFVGRVTTVALSGGYYREDLEAESVLSKQDGWTYALLIERRISESLELSVDGERTIVDYESADQTDKFLGVDVALTWRLGRALSLIGQYEWGQQDSNVSDQNYTGSSIGVGLYYGFNRGPLGNVGP